MSAWITARLSRHLRGTGSPFGVAWPTKRSSRTQRVLASGIQQRGEHKVGSVRMLRRGGGRARICWNLTTTVIATATVAATLTIGGLVTSLVAQPAAAASMSCPVISGPQTTKLTLQWTAGVTCDGSVNAWAIPGASLSLSVSNYNNSSSPTNSAACFGVQAGLAAYSSDTKANPTAPTVIHFNGPPSGSALSGTIHAGSVWTNATSSCSGNGGANSQQTQAFTVSVAPTLTGTNPTSPNASTTVTVLGSASAGTVGIYASTTATCPATPSGIALGSTSAATFSTSGISVTVAAGQTTYFCAYASGGADVSGPSNSISYLSQVTTSLSWSPPAAITYGTALSGTQLDAVVSPSGATGTIAYTYDGGAASASGVVLNAGTHTLTATFTPSSISYTSSTGSVSFVVNQAAQNINFGQVANHTFGDPPFTISAQGGGSGNPVTFGLEPSSTGCSLSGANDSTVTITSATASGSSCVIDANQAGNPNYLAATQVQQSFTIAKATPKISWSAPSPETYGSNLSSAMDPTASFNGNAVAGTFTYTLNGAPVSSATVPDAGTYSNSLVATFTPNDSADYTTGTADQSLTVAQAVQTVSVTDPGPHTYGDAPFTVIATASSGLAPSFSASGACTNVGALVTIVSSGTCTILVTQAGNNDYESASSTVSSAIASYQPTAVWTVPAAVTYGATLGAAQLNAALSYTVDPTATAPTGVWSYTLLDNTSAEGAALGAGATNVTATWTPDSGSSADYLSASLTIGVVVNKATPQLSWTDQSVTYPTPLGSTPLDASVQPFTVGAGLVTPTGTITYTYDGGTTDATGQVLGASAPHTLTANFVPDSGFANDFTSTTKIVNLTVNKGAQLIAFTSPVVDATWGGPPFTISATGGGSTSPVTFASTTPGVCSVGNGTLQSDGSYAATVTIVAAGDCTIAADQSGDSNYDAAVQATQDETVAKATPLVNWAAPASIVYGTPLDGTQLNASVQPSDASGTFTYTLAGDSSASGATLNAGTHQPINVTFNDIDGNYTNASLTEYLDVTQAPQTITFPPIADHTYGDSSFAVSATGGGSSNAVTFTSSGQCTVSPDGTTVQITGAGSCTITANQVGNSNYLDAAAVEQSFAIAKAGQSIGDISNIPSSLVYGNAPFTVSATASSGLSVSFAASGSCSNVKGLVTINSAGDCTVTASQNGDENYDAATPVSVTVTVAKADQTISFTLPPTATYLDAPITAVASSSSGLPVVLSTNDASCSVSGLTVAILHAGTCNVTASQSGNDNYNGAPDVAQAIVIAKFQPGVAWSPTSVTYPATLTGQLDASSTPTGVVDGTFTYSGTGSGGASVNLSGSLDAGTYSVSATFVPNDPADVAGATAQVTITVNKGDQTITFGPIADHTYGDLPFAVSASASSLLPVGFSTTTANCTATSNGDSTGTVTIGQVGPCAVVANQDGNHNYDPATPLARSFDVNQANPTINWNQPAAITYGANLSSALNATASFNGNAVAGTFTYALNGAPVSGTTVPDAGTYSNSLVATFTPSDTTDFTGASAVVSLTVKQAAQAITFPAIANHTYGDAGFSVSASGGASDNAVTFTAAGDCMVSSGGAVQITSAGACSVTANQDGNNDFSAAPSVTNSFAIAKAAQLIGTIGASVTSFTFGDPSFTVSASGGASGNPVTFSGSGACLSGGTNGTTISIVRAGTCTVTANQAGNSDYLDAAPVQQGFTVAQRAQSVTFTLPSQTTFTYSPTLSIPVAATATSGGQVTFTATPASICTVSGTVSVTGVGTCTVTANQAGTANYLAANASDQITITQANQTINFPPITFGAAASLAVNGVPQGSRTVLTAVASSGLSVSYSVTTPGVCTISGSTLTLIGPGTCSVTAGQSGNADYYPATPASQSFSVYFFGGFEPPVRTNLVATKGGPSNNTATSFKQGSTVPVKFVFLNASGGSVPIGSAPAFTISTGAINSNPASSGNTYQWDPTGQQYIYNLGTKNMSPGTYTVGVSIGGTTWWSTPITLSK